MLDDNNFVLPLRLLLASVSVVLDVFELISLLELELVLEFEERTSSCFAADDMSFFFLSAPLIVREFLVDLSDE